MSFADLIDDADELIMASLGDGVGEYRDLPSGVVCCGLMLMLDRNLQQEGPEGLFLSDAVGITWQKSLLPRAERGGIFIHRGVRYIVGQTIADDGHLVTAACRVQK
ncbi:hypothetical protein QYE80_08125 [Pseudomonas tohonis]|nr:hypothetical protein L682_27290 [Pseudomonas alcaligenes OT 69]MDN4144941.1 hypothetical protein [Pseudomonas tohonis]